MARSGYGSSIRNSSRSRSSDRYQRSASSTHCSSHRLPKPSSPPRHGHFLTERHGLRRSTRRQEHPPCFSSQGSDRKCGQVGGYARRARAMSTAPLCSPCILGYSLPPCNVMFICFKIENRDYAHCCNQRPDWHPSLGKGGAKDEYRRCRSKMAAVCPSSQTYHPLEV